MTSKAIITIGVTADDFIRTHRGLVQLLHAIKDAGPNGISTKKLCSEAFNSMRQGMEVLGKAKSAGYIKRSRREKKPRGIGRSYYIINILTPKGEDLLVKLQGQV